MPKNVSQLTSEAIRAYLKAPSKKSTDLTLSYQIASNPASWLEEKAEETRKEDERDEYNDSDLDSAEQQPVVVPTKRKAAEVTSQTRTTKTAAVESVGDMPIRTRTRTKKTRRVSKRSKVSDPIPIPVSRLPHFKSPPADRSPRCWPTTITTVSIIQEPHLEPLDIRVRLCSVTRS